MTEYFSHDYNARNDIKLKRLFMSHGVAGIGIYWCIVEMIYEGGGRIAKEMLPVIAFDLRTDEGIVNSVVFDFGLFEEADGFITSESIQRRLGMRAEKSIKAKNSAKSRWNKSGEDADAMQVQCDGNANAMRTHKSRNANASPNKIKLNKIKEKENNIGFGGAPDAPLGGAPSPALPKMPEVGEEIKYQNAKGNTLTFVWKEIDNRKFVGGEFKSIDEYIRIMDQ